MASVGVESILDLLTAGESQAQRAGEAAARQRVQRALLASEGASDPED
jgi:hypothetical protein